MKVRRFEAPTLREALLKVRAELGSGAVVLTTRNIRRGGVMGLLGQPFVEVTASADLPLGKSEPKAPAAPATGLLERAVQANDRLELERRALAASAANRRPRAAAPSNGGVLAGSASDGDSRTRNEIQALERQIRELETALADVARCTNPEVAPGLPPELARSQRRLVDEGVPNDLARGVVRSAHFAIRESGEDGTSFEIRAALLEELTRRLRTAGPVITERGRRECANVVALCGPTGVGKTTTVAKLAANFKVGQGVDVALVTIDTYRIGAVDQLRIYAEILDVPLEVVQTPEEFAAAIERHRHRDLVLVDTAGRGQRDRARLSDLSEFFAAAPPDEVHLVLSLTTETATLAQVIERFEVLQPQRLILTKLDEAARYGGVIVATARSSLPISYVTTGQEVPDDIAVGEARSLARLVLRQPKRSSASSSGEVIQRPA